MEYNNFDSQAKHLTTCKENRAYLPPSDIDVTALSETRFSGEGGVKDVGYTFFWKGKNANEHHIHGVGVAIKTELVKKHNLAPTSTSERLMIIRILLLNKIYADPSLCSDPRLRRRN